MTIRRCTERLVERHRKTPKRENSLGDITPPKAIREKTMGADLPPLIVPLSKLESRG